MSMNTLDLVYFDIAITSLTAAAPADGFVDNKNPEDYVALPASEILSDAKERANMRYEAIVRYISENISPLSTTNHVATGADVDTEATDFTFRVSYDREEYLSTEDEDNLGTFLLGTDAIKRWVGRALSSDVTSNRYFYNPTLVGGNTVAQGSIIKEVTAGKAAADVATAEAAITVTQII